MIIGLHSFDDNPMDTDVSSNFCTAEYMVSRNLERIMLNRMHLEYIFKLRMIVSNLYFLLLFLLSIMHKTCIIALKCHVDK